MKILKSILNYIPLATFIIFVVTDGIISLTSALIFVILIIAIVFIMFALNHPEKSFPWSNTITWLLYGVYFLVTVVLLIAPKMKK